MAITKKLAAAAAAATLVFSFAAEAAQTLRVGSLTVYPPFEYLDSKTGQYEGFDMDLIREIGRRNDLDIRIVSMSLDGLVPALISGNIDCAVSALTITPERSEKVDFTKPYMNAGLTVMTTKDNAPQIKSLKDLEKKTRRNPFGPAGFFFDERSGRERSQAFNQALKRTSAMATKRLWAM